MRTEDYTNLLFNRTGTYLFPTFTALAPDLTGNTTGAKDWCTFTQTIGNPVVDFYIHRVLQLLRAGSVQGHAAADAESGRALRLRRPAAADARRIRIIRPPAAFRPTTRNSRRASALPIRSTTRARRWSAPDTESSTAAIPAV